MRKVRQTPRTELAILVAMLIVFAIGFGLTYTFSARTEIYPRAVSGIAMVLVVLELAAFGLRYYRTRSTAPPVRQEALQIVADIRGIVPYVLWILFYFLLIYLIGLIIASGIFSLLFVLLIGKMKWWQAAIGGLGASVAAFLITDILTLALPTALFDPFIEFRNILRLPF